MKNCTFKDTIMKRFEKLVWTGMLVALVATLGCSQSQPELNKVQPDALKKEWLSGEWYHRETIYEAAALAMNSFPGAQSALERGVFEIQQDTLYFYRTYEYATGTETPGQSSDVDTPLLDASGEPVMTTKVVNGEEVASPVYVYRGAPVAAFPVLKHFDVKASYNPATGEKTNVISENTSDNKWYDREWMRVDWSGVKTWSFAHPLAGNVSWGINPASGGGEAEQPVFEWSGDGSENLEYFDYSARVILKAPEIWYPYYGAYIPACWFFPWAYGQVFECASEEIGLRHAFMRPQKDNDYVAYDLDDKQLDKFGYYRAERPTFDEERGITYSGVSRKMIRQRIWENHVLGEDGRLDYDAMDPKPIVYYLSPDFPRDLVVPSIEIAAEWSEAFETTVKALKGGDYEIGHDMFILCENNLEEAVNATEDGLPTAVWSDDGENPNAAYCDVDEKAKRFGDLRYSFLASVNQPISYGLLGYGPPSWDPLTGEVINSNAYSYTAAMKRSATRALDTIEMMAGVRTFLEIENASYIKLHGKTKRLKSSGGGKVSYTNTEVQEMASSLISPEVRVGLETVGLKEDLNFAQTRMNMLKGRPDIEELAIGEDVQALLKDPSHYLGEGMSMEVLDKVLAPRNWANDAGMRLAEREDHDHAMATMYMESFADDAILGLVREYKERYDASFCTDFEGQFPTILDWDVFTDVAASCAQQGAINDAGWVCTLLTKEVGEGSEGELYWVNKCETAKLISQMRLAVEDIEGLDPNASYDPASPLYVDTKNQELNEAVIAFRTKLDTLREVYHIELWQMVYKGTQLHEVGHNLGLRHNFEASTDAMNFEPEYWDLKVFKDSEGEFHPVNLWQRDTEEQVYNKLREMQSATVMDYSSKFNGRNAGLGHYDHAAIQYGYGHLVEVFNTAPDAEALAPYMAEPPTGGSLGGLPLIPTSGDDLEDAFKRIHHSRYPSFFGESVDAMYDRSLKREDELTAEDTEVPYRFCSDEQAGYLPTCQRWDEGVDPFEIVINYADNYENYWPLMGYSHNQVTWSYNNYYSGVQRYFGEMRNMFQLWVQQMVYYNENDWWANSIGNGTPWELDINGGLTYTMAARESFNVISNVFGRPAEARFGRNPNTGRYEPINYYVTTTYTNQVEITQDDGARPFYNAYDFSGYVYVPHRAGAIYDRLNAYYLLSDPSMRRLIATETVSDTQRYLTSYYSLFPKEMVRLFGSLMTGDEQNYGWWTCKNSQGKVDSIVRRDQFSDVPPESCEQALYPETFSVFPNSRYRMPILGALYGMAMLTTNNDYSFMDASRLCLQGSGECVSVQDVDDVATFEDPFSGKVYSASRVGDAGSYDAAYNLVKAAQTEFDNYINPETGELNLGLLQDNYYLSELQFLVGRLELVRGMHQKYSL
jgi:hypothetical protein